MKRVLLCLLCVSLFSLSARAADAAPAAASAGAMILVHPGSGTVLASKNADEPMLIASTTKLMTALTAIRLLDPDACVEIRPEWTQVEGSSMYLRPGESYTVRELLQGLLLASGNDAALALAAAAAGDTERFVARMNEEAAALGLTNTHFDNPHGLDSPGHHSTAADLARLMEAAMDSEPLREIMAERSCTVHGLVYENHNKLLRSCPGVCAGKTGYTSAAGRCLVTCCRRDGLELICVTLSDRDDWNDHTALYDWAFAHYRPFSVSAGEELARVPVLSGDPASADLTADRDLSLCVPADSEVQIRCSLPEFVFAPLGCGDPAGEWTVCVDGRPAGHGKLVCARDVLRARTAVPVLREVIDRFIGIYCV